MLLYSSLIAKWATLTGTTDEKLAAINALTVAGPNQAVEISTVMAYLRTNGLWLPIKAAVTTSQGAAAAVDLNEDMRMQSIDFGLPIVGAMLADLVSHGLLTQAQSDALVALGKTTMPWWSTPVEQGGGGLSSSVSLNDLVAAGGLS